MLISIFFILLFYEQCSGLLYYALFLVFDCCFGLQEQKLLDEIDRLKEELQDCDENINRRKSEITTLESLIAQSREGLNRYKEERDKLHGERKYVTPLLSSFFFFFKFLCRLFTR